MCDLSNEQGSHQYTAFKKHIFAYRSVLGLCMNRTAVPVFTLPTQKEKNEK